MKQALAPHEHDFMNDQASTEPIPKNYTRYYLIGGVAVAACFIGYLIFGGSTTPPSSSSSKENARDDPVIAARVALNRATDVITCRDALNQLNQHLSKQPLSEQLRLSPADADALKKHFELKDDEWKEINSDAFTLLDGHYLETAFVLRDAAASFTRESAAELPPLERAKAAFAWAVRQVLVRESGDADAPPLPVGFVLRRGFGTPLERALTFLDLLQQFDVPGCLVAADEPFGSRFPLWCCGALIGRDIYLFDPRMGIALPGPDGKGVATLASVQANPELLKQLTTDAGHRYDVTPEQARKARVYIAPPLSALAPRMRFLEKALHDPEVPAPVIGGHFAADANRLLAAFDEALAQSAGKDHAPAQAWPLGARALRAILPPSEGGHDQTQKRLDYLRFSLLPLRAFPPQVTPQMGIIYQKMVEKFGTPFLSLWFNPRQPRDALLRGQFSESSKALTGLRQETLRQKARLDAQKGVLLGELTAKLPVLIRAQAQFLKAQREGAGDLGEIQTQLEAAWKDAHGWLDTLIEGAAAGPLGQEVGYQLALTKHEQAERLQLRADEAARLGKADAAASDDVRRAWHNAADWWRTFLGEHANAPTAPAARVHASRAQLMLNERDSALDLLRADLSGKLTDLEIVGRLFLVKQAQAKK